MHNARVFVPMHAHIPQPWPGMHEICAHFVYVTHTTFNMTLFQHDSVTLCIYIYSYICTTQAGQLEHQKLQQTVTQV